MTTVRFPIELGHVMTFARALGTRDDGYYRALETGSPDAAGVPPTFAQSACQWDPDYWSRPHPDRPWRGSGRDAGTAPEAGGIMHAEQHFTFHRPPQIGDVLTRTDRAGTTWEKQGRSGLLRFEEYLWEFRDDTGALVVTSRAVSVTPIRSTA